MSNVPTSPFQNGAQGSILGAVVGAQGAGLTNSQAQLAMQQMQYNNAIMSANPPVMLREGYFTKARRLHVEVDVVTNGFVLDVGNERLIAKDIEELQQHFVAQVASLLLEKDK